MAKATEQRLGPLYRWRGVSVARDASEVGLSFETGMAEILRFRLTGDHARHLAEAIRDQLAAKTGSHSDRSSGRPSVDVSTPPEGENV